ncbi:MAG TPA: argininosuccinate lyase [Lentisphaeria bacterium]|nr:argininosuccinate lyase [Lentisphaerota bacterium]OQC13508.1 MAG: Argininosuccinate lyase 1 [Lentisphaerae bacterium ADurb.Bin082]HQC53337.1 argininosuccinate lyase [Lentisphaeria bacterium]HQL86938.1 argininosuccinate lyase [Lentisphaeria bacterium]
MALWSGRFSEATDSLVSRFSESISFDRRLYPFDIQGSKAHARMLARQNIISQADADVIVAGLDGILADIEAGRFDFCEELEDIHMNIEARLTERIGQAGARLHTGRSRNDQVATDERLYLRHETDACDEALRALQRTLVDLGMAWPNVIMPGFTHLQHAQPVLFAHHLLAYVEMFGRDRERLADGRRRINRLPLGAGAIAGSTLPLDREFVAAELGFEEILRNSMDAVGDRDALIEFLSCLAIIAMHISRLAEDIVLWFSQEFAFIELGDAFTTGSSLMPQKKNPDVAELARGKTGRVYGHLMALLTTMKGLPLTYNRDMQEDKEGLFDAVDTVQLTLATMTAMLATLKPRQERMAAAASDPALMATDLAEWLVRRGTPFREAHHQVGRFVGFCAEHGLALNQATLEQMQQSIPSATAECLELFDAQRSVEARNLLGGTAPGQVARQLAFWQQRLQ